LLQVTILLPGLKKKVKAWSFMKSTKDEAFHEIWVLLKPLLWGLIAYRIIFLCIKLLAMMQSEGDVAAFGYAEFIVLSLVDITGISLSTAFFPTLSEYYARNKEKEFLSSIQSFFRITSILTIPAMVLLVNFRTPLINLLFYRGSFTWENTLRTADFLLLFSPIVVFESFIYVIRNAFYAMREMKTPVIIAIVSMCSNFILIWILLSRQGTAGIIIATSIAYGIHSTSLLFFFVLKFRNFDLKSFLYYVVKLAAASLIAILFSNVAMFCSTHVIKKSNFLWNSLHLGIAFFVFLVCFVIVARVFSISEITDTRQWLRRKSGIYSGSE
jgi:putative peptidoglycan lipid II flippase